MNSKIHILLRKLRGNKIALISVYAIAVYAILILLKVWKVHLLKFLTSYNSISSLFKYILYDSLKLINNIPLLIYYIFRDPISFIISIINATSISTVINFISPVFGFISAYYMFEITQKKSKQNKNLDMLPYFNIYNNELKFVSRDDKLPLLNVDYYHFDSDKQKYQKYPQGHKFPNEKIDLQNSNEFILIRADTVNNMEIFFAHNSIPKYSFQEFHFLYNHENQTTEKYLGHITYSEEENSNSKKELTDSKEILDHLDKLISKFNES